MCLKGVRTTVYSIYLIAGKIRLAAQKLSYHMRPQIKAVGEGGGGYVLTA